MIWPIHDDEEKIIYLEVAPFQHLVNSLTS